MKVGAEIYKARGCLGKYVKPLALPLNSPRSYPIDVPSGYESKTIQSALVFAHTIVHNNPSVNDQHYLTHSTIIR